MLELVRDPPRTVGALAAAFGVRLADHVGHGPPLLGTVALPSARADAVSVIARCSVDIHHRTPPSSAAELEDERLTSYTARLIAGRDALEAELRARHGAGVEVAGRRRYGPFFVSAGDEPAAFDLEWHDREPRWARPRVDPSTRESALADLRSRIERAADDAEAGAAVAALRLDLEPPLAARELARALGHPDAAGQSVDVHMASYCLALPSEPIGAIRIGRHLLEASLTGPLLGPRVPGVDVPASIVRQLGPDDEVLEVRLRPG